MEIGNQIKYLRLCKGVTQETMADALGVTAQAVSKWERGATTPDIQLLPEMSAYFGVSIDELFALSDETRMERISNMLWNERILNPADVEAARGFLLEKARRDPANEQPYTLLAEMENQLAQEHYNRAAEFAKEALKRNPRKKDAHGALVKASGGTCVDWCVANHRRLIDYYKEFVEQNPDYASGYLWLMDELINDERFDEAKIYCARMAQIEPGYRTPLYQGIIAWRQGDRQTAMDIWQQMQQDYPDEWCVWLSMGDVMARSSRFEEAKVHYRRAYETQPVPRYTDALDSIAQVCELAGDIPGAIHALEEELELLAREWNIVSGETADAIRREIIRLKERG